MDERLGTAESKSAISKKPVEADPEIAQTMMGAEQEIHPTWPWP